ncbi:MAG TPA: NAD(+)--dinitrogen-reductase ADP-D-ribosyltransferase [Polyangiaceae bacterium]
MATTLNLCNLPSWVLASRDYNDHPTPLVIQGATSADRQFFARLDAADDPEQRAELFEDYMTVKFYLDQWSNVSEGAKKSIRNSYVRFIRGWGIDSNAPEAAVLKAWVESRFGIAPTFHKVRLSAQHGTDYSPYELDRTRGIARTNSIYGQFDLVYAYCQYELIRQHSEATWLTLYRGTYGAEEHEILERDSRRSYSVRLNNLCSFTSEMEHAWEFGTTVWSVRVPRSKVFFFGDLLPRIQLKGENEYMVIGGEYRVEEIWG